MRWAVPSSKVRSVILRSPRPSAPRWRRAARPGPRLRLGPRRAGLRERGAAHDRREQERQRHAMHRCRQKTVRKTLSVRRIPSLPTTAVPRHGCCPCPDQFAGLPTHPDHTPELWPTDGPDAEPGAAIARLSSNGRLAMLGMGRSVALSLIAIMALSCSRSLQSGSARTARTTTNSASARACATAKRRRRCSIAIRTTTIGPASRTMGNSIPISSMATCQVARPAPRQGRRRVSVGGGPGRALHGAASLKVPPRARRRRRPSR